MHQDGWISKPVRSKKSASSPSADEPSLSGARKAAVLKQVNDVIIDRLALAGEGQSQVVRLFRSSSAALLGGGAPSASSSSTLQPSQTAVQPDNPDSNNRQKNDESKAFNTTTYDSLNQDDDDNIT